MEFCSIPTIENNLHTEGNFNFIEGKNIWSTYIFGNIPLDARIWFYEIISIHGTLSMYRKQYYQLSVLQAV